MMENGASAAARALAAPWSWLRRRVAAPFHHAGDLPGGYASWVEKSPTPAGVGCGKGDCGSTGPALPSVLQAGAQSSSEDEFDEELEEEFDDEFELELLEEFDELFELELLDELELEFELEFREEFDELLELRLEFQLPRRSSSRSRLERTWLALLLRTIFCRKRWTGSSATAGAGAAAPATSRAPRIAMSFFMVCLL